MNEERLQTLYNSASERYNLGSFDDFKKRMSSRDNRAVFYDEVKDTYINEGETFEEFEAILHNRLTPKTKEEILNLPPGYVEQQQLPDQTENKRPENYRQLWKEAIAAAEGNGSYYQENPSTNAAGKYQMVPSQQYARIEQITNGKHRVWDPDTNSLNQEGLSAYKSDFEAQEQVMDSLLADYEERIPALRELAKEKESDIKRLFGRQLKDHELAYIIHREGPAGAVQFFEDFQITNPENNVSFQQSFQKMDEVIREYEKAKIENSVERFEGLATEPYYKINDEQKSREEFYNWLLQNKNTLGQEDVSIEYGNDLELDSFFENLKIEKDFPSKAPELQKEFEKDNPGFFEKAAAIWTRITPAGLLTQKLGVDDNIVKYGELFDQGREEYKTSLDDFYRWSDAILNDEDYTARNESIQHFEDEYKRAVDQVGGEGEMTEALSSFDKYAQFMAKELGSEGASIVKAQLGGAVGAGAGFLVAGPPGAAAGYYTGAAGVGAVDAVMQEAGAAFRGAYFNLRNQGLDPGQAFDKATTVAYGGAVGGAAEGVIGAIPMFGKLGGKVAGKALGEAAKEVVEGATKKATRETIKTGIETAADSGLAVVNQALQNSWAIYNDIDQKFTEGFAEEALAEAMFSLGIQIPIKGVSAANYLRTLPKNTQQNVLEKFNETVSTKQEFNDIVLQPDENTLQPAVVSDDQPGGGPVEINLQVGDEISPSVNAEIQSSLEDAADVERDGQFFINDNGNWKRQYYEQAPDSEAVLETEEITDPEEIQGLNNEFDQLSDQQKSDNKVNRINQPKTLENELQERQVQGEPAQDENITKKNIDQENTLDANKQEVQNRRSNEDPIPGTATQEVVTIDGTDFFVNEIEENTVSVLDKEGNNFVIPKTIFDNARTTIETKPDVPDDQTASGIEPETETAIAAESSEIENVLDQAEIDRREIDSPVPISVNKPTPDVVENYKQAPKQTGKEDSIVTPDGTEVNGRWVVVDFDDVLPSHNSENFSQNPGFPTTEDGATVNDRDYAKDRNAQATVIVQGNNYDRRALDEPIVIKDGVTISGNGRTIAGQRAGRENTNQKYQAALPEKAKEKGITDISGFTNPGLFFEVTDDIPINTETFAKFNQSEKKAKDAFQEAVTRSRTVDDRTAKVIGDIVGDFETVEQFYQNKKAVRETIKALTQSGNLANDQLPAYYSSATQSLTPNGKFLLENIFTGKLFDEDVIGLLNQDVHSGLKKKLTNVAPFLLANKNFKDFSILPVINDAIRLAEDIENSGLSIDDYLEQGNLFDEGAEKYSPEALGLYTLLSDKSLPKLIRPFLERYNKNAASALQGGGADLFSDVALNKGDILNTLINSKFATDAENQATTFTKEERDRIQAQKKRFDSKQSSTGSTGQTDQSDQEDSEQNNAGISRNDRGSNSPYLRRKGISRVQKEGRKSIGSLISQIQASFPNIDIITNADEVREAYLASGMSAVDGSKAFYYDGKVYLSYNEVSPSDVLHEFGHVWVDLLEKTSPDIYATVSRQIQDSPIFTAVTQDEYYQTLSKDDQIKEALAFAIEEKGIQQLNKGSFSKMINSIWSAIKRALDRMGFKPPVNLANISLDDLMKTASREILGSTPLSTVSSNQLNQAAMGTLNGGTPIIDSISYGLMDDRRKNNKSQWWFPRAVRLARTKLSANRSVNNALKFASNEALSLVKSKLFRAEELNHRFSETLRQYVKENKLNEFDGKKIKYIHENKELSDLYESINSFLRGEAMAETLPEQLQEISIDVREKINALQQSLIANNIIIGNNIVSQLNNDLAIYLDSNWNINRELKELSNKYKKDRKKDIQALVELSDEQLSAKVSELKNEVMDQDVIKRQRTLTNLNSSISKLESDKRLGRFKNELLRKLELAKQAIDRTESKFGIDLSQYFEDTVQRNQLLTSTNQEIKKLQGELDVLLEEKKKFPNNDGPWEPGRFDDEELFLINEIKEAQDYLKGISDTFKNADGNPFTLAYDLTTEKYRNFQSENDSQRRDLSVETIFYKPSEVDGKDFQITLRHVNGQESTFDLTNTELELLVNDNVYRNAVRRQSGHHDFQDPQILTDNNLYHKLQNSIGNYIHRSYEKWDNPYFARNVHAIVGKEVYDTAANHIRNTFRNSALTGVNVEKTDKGFELEFTNASGLKSSKMVVSDLKDLARYKKNGFLYQPDVDFLVKTVTDENPSADVVLDNRVEIQNQVDFVVTDGDIDNLLNQILRTETSLEGVSYKNFDLSIFRKRKEIDEPIRRVMGEYLDPSVNTMKTFSKIEQALANQQWSLNIYEQLEKDKLFRTEDEGPGSIHTEKIDISDSPYLWEKGVRYVSPEVKAALWNKNKEQKDNWQWNALMLTINLPKMALTVGSVASQARNFLGMLKFMLVSGNLNYVDLKYASSVASQDFKTKDELVTVMSPPLFLLKLMAGKNFGLEGSGGEGRYNKEALVEMHEEVKRLGLVNQSIGAGQVTDVLDSLGKTNKFLEFFKGLGRSASKVYQLTDSIGKVAAYIGEKQRLEKAYPELRKPENQDELQKQAADKVLKMQPSYERLPKVIREIGRSPFGASFISFTFATYQTRFNILNEAKKEIQEGIKTGNNELIKIGSQRLGTFAFGVIGVPLGVRTVSKSFGWDEEEEKHMNELYPSYGTYNMRMYLSTDKMNPSYLDVSYVDPDAVLYKPLLAYLQERAKGKSMSRAVFMGGRQLVDPFVDTEIAIDMMRMIANGRDDYDNALWDKSKPLPHNSLWILDVMGPVILPLYRETRGIYRGIAHPQTSYGKTFDLTQEIANTVVGLRLRKLDLQKKAVSVSRRYNKEISDIRKNFKKDVLDNTLGYKPVSDDEYHRVASQRASVVFNDYLFDVKGFDVLGFSEKDIRSIFKSARIPNYQAEELLAPNAKFLGIDRNTGEFVSKSKY